MHSMQATPVTFPRDFSLDGVWLKDRRCVVKRPTLQRLTHKIKKCIHITHLFRERLLFLPSVGMMLMLAYVFSRVEARSGKVTPDLGLILTGFRRLRTRKCTTL